MIMRCSTGSQCAPFQVDAQCSYVQWTGMALSFEDRCKRELKRSGCPLHGDAEDKMAREMMQRIGKSAWPCNLYP